VRSSPFAAWRGQDAPGTLQENACADKGRCAAVWGWWPRLAKEPGGKDGGPVVPEKRSAGGSIGQEGALGSPELPYSV
jgi:hypothetical protein